MSVKKINGYKILLNQQLGQGAYGSVYKGEQDGTKQECAIKIVDKKKISSDPYLKSALLSEIQIMAKLKSPNIVGFYDVLQSNHNYYIVQQLCDGDLQKQLNKQPQGKFSQKKAIEILAQICNGFLTLIREGIIHRDLKPANILIGKGIMKIGDFGFAKQNIHKRVKNESSVGTPLYMSIQLLKGNPYTSKCDIWALGCIFYELIHGETPFNARTQFQLVEKIQKEEFYIDKKVSQITKDFLLRTLRVREQDRICWDDLFKHPIFNGIYNEYLDEHNQLENKYKKVMSDLRFKVNSDNIDLKKLWASIGYEQTQDLNFQEFQNFIESINPDMVEAQVIYFFEKMDANGDGSISFTELEKQFTKYNISMTSKYANKIPLQVRKTTSINENLQMSFQPTNNERLKMDEQFEKRVRSCFIRLNKIIQNKKLTLYKTFLAYDANNSGVLNLDQFSKIIRKLDPSFKPDQIQSVFQLIDEDGSNTVQFDELNNYYCKINGIPIDLHLPKDYKENKKKRKIKDREETRKKRTF